MKKIEMIKVSDITPDPEQPRTNFRPERMATLKASVEKYGILSPLIVEQVGKGYLLIDGERRYRTAVALGLKEVPALIEEPKTATNRLIEQFHVQEQHEKWTLTEKATAILKLSNAMKVSVKDLCRMLALPEEEIRNHVAFGALLNRKEFEKTEASFDFAINIIKVRNAARHAKKAADEEFTKEEERDFEDAVIQHIKSGDIRDRGGFANLGAAIKTDHTTVDKITKDKKATVQKIFNETGAKAFALYRDTIFSANYINSYINKGIPLKMAKYLDKSGIAALRRAEASIVELIGKA